MNIENSLYYVPAVKSLKLKNIGVWNDAVFNFSDKMNIITGNGGSGKSTIIKSIVNVMFNNSQSKRLEDKINSRIELDLTGGKLASEYVGNNQGNQILCGNKSLLLSESSNAFNNLSQSLSRKISGYAILIDDFFDMMDFQKTKKVLNLLLKTEGQKILVIRHLIEIKNARIFECSVNIDRQSSEVAVRDD